ncbi:GAF domain-containing protein [Friedmanniella luteola]|uniref:GAF domain-containing protein n=1 Tax=Friedmanniella luteola TaxID=546871 RepID=A0A1H1WL89_9ACTN|nr:GAF and ANTAR domain-containing protein [Friedmanniella luteola]SDS98088.1 GAF domain-containing protein [Friedmanniella luteola]
MSIEGLLISAVGGQRGVAAADRLCRACVNLLAVDAAAISLVFDGVSTGTLGSSSELARQYDELQFTVGEGPCLESVSTRAPVLVFDLAADIGTGRWPGYGPALLAYGIVGVFAMPVLVAGEYVGALDLFRTRTASLEGQDLSGALVAAELAEMPLLDLLTDNLEKSVADPSTAAWAELNQIARAEVNQATGMLVAQLDVGPAEALVRLRAHAYATNRSATEVARDILERRLRLAPD